MRGLLLISCLFYFVVSAHCQKKDSLYLQEEGGEMTAILEKEITEFVNQYFVLFKKYKAKKSLDYFLDKDDVERLVWKIKELEGDYNPDIDSMTRAMKVSYLGSVKGLKRDLSSKAFDMKNAYLREVSFDFKPSKVGIPTVEIRIRISDNIQEYYLFLGDLFYLRGAWKLSSEVKILN